MHNGNYPKIIQGGMGAAVSNWRLANAVSRLGQLGVVSGTALDQILARRLQDGDHGGHIRRALDHFPFPAMAERIWQSYFIPGGKHLLRVTRGKHLHPGARPGPAVGDLQHPGAGRDAPRRINLTRGQFQLCQPGITITPSAVNEVGQPHTFNVHVFNNSGGTSTDIAGAHPTVTLTTANGAVVTNKVDTCADDPQNASALYRFSLDGGKVLTLAPGLVWIDIVQ